MINAQEALRKARHTSLKLCRHAGMSPLPAGDLGRRLKWGVSA